MPASVPGPLTGSSTGLADTQWIADMRNRLADSPIYRSDSWTGDGTNGTIGYVAGSPTPSPAAMPISLQAKPVNNANARVFLGSVEQTVIYTGSPSAGQALVTSDTGQVSFSVAPAAATVVQISYQVVKWTDQSILDGLYAGLRAINAAGLGRTRMSYVGIQANTYDYQLPEDFANPRSRILKVEIADPNNAVTASIPIKGWYRTGVDQIHIPGATRYSVAGMLRLTGYSPYTALGDLEPDLHELPIWFALAELYRHAEGKRLRTDTLVPQAGAGQAPALQHAQLAGYYDKQFQTQLKAAKRAFNPGHMPQMVTPGDRRHG